MMIIYLCNHCGQEIGRLENSTVPDASMLGWDGLSQEDKQQMIQYQDNGDVHVHAICESCEESLGRHPGYHELDHFIQ
ncbi:uncharacterized protein JNUCC1_01833 [Lentibacillus sp. JNUCC-1]|uniref:anti-sigma-F factor Fin n=1 Tax=Lentibacillus sp. JNUCC-1 TaxID=2654513 RepID=UPI0012E85C2E|nr:anti-sigma-F factor Fin [Lentibacillus sp. JNUCC-1]MUV38025.1 uncharacterized protein [Lentibacillus sp. JNUCC-1]